MEDLPVSFAWIPHQFKNDGSCITYCFAYIRDPKTYNVIYAGVKYKGKFCDLKFYKKSLRKTAIERLKKKPIFAIFSLGDDEKYKENLTNPSFRFNGFSSYEKDAKKTTALGKFFIYCALNQTYSDLGICANKSSSDFKFYLSNDKYEVVLNKNASGEEICHVKCGYEFRGNELKRIILSPQLIESIFSMRKRAKFYGANKLRQPFEKYYELDKLFLEQFGVSQTIHKEKPKKYELFDYVLDKHIVFYRINLSKNTQAHIALMDFHDWSKYVNKVYNKDFYFDIRGLLFNTYCMGFVVTSTVRNDYQKKITRKIAVDRMIDRPNIVDANFLEGKEMKDIRTWFGDRLGYFDEKGVGRINYKNNTIHFDSYYYTFERYDETIKVYVQKEGSLLTWIGSLFKPVRKLFNLFLDV